MHQLVIRVLNITDTRVTMKFVTLIHRV